MGCDEVGLGDTLGVGTPKLTQQLLDLILQDIPASKLTGHFHDTYGQVVANVIKAYEMGLRTFDTSVAGLGGCPHAPGARGNAATEDVVYALATSGVNTGVDLDSLVRVGQWISEELQMPNNSRAGAAISAKQARSVPSATTLTASSVSLQTSKSAVKQGSSTTQRRVWAVQTQAEGYTVSRAGNTVRITLNRHANGNAMTFEMLEPLTKLYEDLATDRSVFHIVLAAEGKIYCTGMDLTGSSRDNPADYHDKIVALFKAIDNAPQTTIAAIHGPCYGGGVGLGFGCGVRLVSSNATWRLSEIKLGISPAIISKYMAREWGPAFFREAMLSGREVSAAELHRIGSIHGVAESEPDLDALVERYLDRLAHAAPQVAATCKQLVRLAFSSRDSPAQDDFIRRTFDNMLAPHSEGQYGISQFQRKVKNIDWSEFWAAKLPCV